MAGANTNGVEKLFNPDVLDRMKKNELIDLILQLQTEKEAIKEERNSFVLLTFINELSSWNVASICMNNMGGENPLKFRGFQPLSPTKISKMK